MRLSEQDASFLYGETASGPLQTAGVYGLDGAVSFQEVFDHYAARIHLVPRLRQRLMFVPFNLSHPKWVEDPDFDISNHIVHEPLPEGTSMEDAIDKICELNEGIMDRNLPLWKFFVVTGVPDKTLILQQAHHAMIDGASAIQMSTLLLDFEPNAEPPPPEENPWNPPPLPSGPSLLSESMQELGIPDFGNTLSMDSSQQAMIQRGISSMARFLTEPAITAPWNAAPVGPKRRLTWIEKDLAEFREIRRVFGGTINDVALAVVSEGAARYLEQHNENTNGQRFRVMCPVNVRTEDQKGALGNQVSAIFPMFPAYSLDLPERYKAVCEETTRIKQDQEAQAMTLMQSASPGIPPVTMLPLLLVGTPFDPTRLAATFPLPVPANFGVRPPNPGINFVLTNVPGVQVPQYLAGREVVDMTAIMMIGGNMGLGIAVGSYNQRMIFNFTADPRLLPDLELLTDLIDGVYNELLELARANNQEES